MSTPIINSNRENGFTIIETIIVLAIAGIILLLVLFAIPNLQRSGRNNQRAQDVQTILDAVSQYELNHSGNIPDTADLRSLLDTYYHSKLTYYTTSNITVCPATPIEDPPYCSASDKTTYYDNNSTVDTVIVNNHAKCYMAFSLGGYTNTGAGYSDVVALYRIETRTDLSPKCQQL